MVLSKELPAVRLQSSHKDVNIDRFSRSPFIQAQEETYFLIKLYKRKRIEKKNTFSVSLQNLYDGIYDSMENSRNF